MSDRERELEALLERCYVFLVGYNPQTMEGPSDPLSKMWLVGECLTVVRERNDRLLKENEALRADVAQLEVGQPMMKEVLDELRLQQRRLVAEMEDAQGRVDRMSALIARLMLAQEQAERKVLGVAPIQTPDDAPPNGGAA